MAHIYALYILKRIESRIKSKGGLRDFGLADADIHFRDAARVYPSPLNKSRFFQTEVEGRSRPHGHARVRDPLKKTHYELMGPIFARRRCVSK